MLRSRALQNQLQSISRRSGPITNRTRSIPILLHSASCQVPAPPSPRPLPSVLARYNSSVVPPRIPKDGEKPHLPQSPQVTAAGTESIPPSPASGSSSNPKSTSTESENLSFGQKVSKGWSTPTKWYPIPLALGALVLLAVQFRKEQQRDNSLSDVKVDSQSREGAVVRRSRMDGPWQVRVLGALPLRSLSQLWGYLNSLVLPVWFRPFGFRLYSRIFGCNLDEMAEPDLTKYDSLGEFFYRELKPGARTIDEASMVSPADGRVLHYGEIVGEQVEQVKGLTYSLSALLGNDESATETSEIRLNRPHQHVDDQHFAEINDISYSLSSLLGEGKASQIQDRSKHADSKLPKTPMETEVDASHPPEDSNFAHDASVAIELGSAAISTITDNKDDTNSPTPPLNPNNKLFFFVVYLAPGDYHRFHSPTTWVVERRRHFTGDLFSVSPYIANRLKNLFVLNERVALLGRWKHGFFSMVPVGATNVGSIRINFDESLRTNTNSGQAKKEPHTFSEAAYTSASVLRGQPLLSGEEMGGFRLGSTIVLVFEAPKDFQFIVEAGKKIKVGEALGKFGGREEGESQNEVKPRAANHGVKVKIGK